MFHKQLTAVLLYLFCNFSIAVAGGALDSTGRNSIKTKNIGEVVELIKKSKEKKGIRPAESLAAAEEALALAKKIDDTLFIVLSLNQLGRVYSYMEYPERAMEVLLKAVVLCEKSGLKKELSASYNEIGGIFYNQSDYKMAGKYFSKSLDIRLYLDEDKVAISSSLNNVGETFRLKGDNRTALVYYERALEINEKLGVKTSIAANCANIGYIYLNQDKFEDALKYFTKGNEAAISGGDKKDLANPLINLGLYHLKMGDAAKAVDYFSKGLQAAKDVYQRLDQIDAVKGLSDAYAKLGDHKKAYAYLSEYYRKKDSVQTLEKERKLLELHLKLETMQKEKIKKPEDDETSVNETQGSQKTLIYMIGCAGTVAILAIVFLFLNRKRKKSSINK